MAYMNTDRQSIGIAHERFEVKCEFWAGEEKIAEGTFAFSVKADVSRPNKHLDACMGITYRRDPAPTGGTGSGGNGLATLPAPAPTRIKWTRDGRGIAYAGPGSNLWVLPLDGTPPRQLTRFTDGRTIANFAWSRDGKRLAIARATVTDDIVLFKGLWK